ncbi:probable Golgi SNAP receptor complex member 2 isoform X1 [Zophobas morio]|uniref:probable Golgi SNAP receptor complex member 2 isoform X1 n=1 Tax=Zophobas morio TaxID=2755281 RepID=UPI0030833AB4
MEGLYQQIVNASQSLHEMILKYEQKKEIPTLTKEAGLLKEFNNLQEDYARLTEYRFRQNFELRGAFKGKMEQLKYDLELLKSAIDQFRRKNENLRALKTREELLLNHKFFPVRNQETSIGIDPFSRESDLLDEAHRQMDALLFQGSYFYQNIIESGNMFKKAHLRVVNMMGSMDLSQSLLRLIERRQAQDYYILIGGILATSSIVWAAIHYFM